MAWPNPRFTDNLDGTVTDHLTDLVWLQAPECGSLYDTPDTTWTAAVTAATGLASPSAACDLNDSSLAGEWRIPNVREFLSLSHFGYFGGAVSNTAGDGKWDDDDPFAGLHVTFGTSAYWGSTAYANRADLVWCDLLYDGKPFTCPIEPSNFFQYVWMVRGGTAADPPAPVPATGQTNSIQSGDDGALQMGKPWPVPRFTDNLNGTVTDNLTGLVWLKDAECFGTDNWPGALSDANTLEDKSPGFQDCGLTDGSSPGDWRLPNLRELESLVHYGFENKALPNTDGTGQWAAGDPFTDVTSGGYWSSTTAAESTERAWWVAFTGGYSGDYSKSTLLYVWPVRDPQ